MVPCYNSAVVQSFVYYEVAARHYTYHTVFFFLMIYAMIMVVFVLQLVTQNS